MKHCRLAGTPALAVLLLTLGNGVPVHGHTHQDGHAPHANTPDHAHGFALVQYDIRTTPVAAPVLAVPCDTWLPTPEASPVLERERPSPRDQIVQSRAPPAARPRAPPL
ncbi:MAG: hypothetical protein R3195_08965 [Gemmatimonadota bacterium]|nr:hypothetical protein [Gemmatimonadota bacterium]